MAREDMTAQILREDGSEVVKGDPGSIRGIFNMLSGKAFEKGQPPNLYPTHDDYLAYMESEYGPLYGTTLIMLDHGKELRRYTLPARSSQG